MTKDKFDLLGPLMNDIGQEILSIIGGDTEDIFLYVEIGEGWIGSSVYKNEEDCIRYYRTRDSNLSNLLREAWLAEPEGQNMRWSVLEYNIRGGKFDVVFRYPEEVQVDVYDKDDGRREAAVRARFGDKPVVYPPRPKGAFELKS
jgi:hypothetical protein